MPVQSCSDNERPGYKWGEQGVCYTYSKGNLSQKKRAKRRAFYQGLAMGEASNFKKSEDLTEEEAMLADALLAIATMYGKFNEDESGIWAGYDSPEENDVKDIGVKCSNCVLYEGNGVCKIIAQQVEEEGKCRFAVIPDGIVEFNDLDLEEYDRDYEDYEKNINVTKFDLLRYIIEGLSPFGIGSTNKEIK